MRWRKKVNDALTVRTPVRTVNASLTHEVMENRQRIVDSKGSGNRQRAHV
jgi:hypothetical protein